MRRPGIGSISAAAGAALLVLLSARLPLWTLEMEAPQYPKGLVLRTYGTRMTGDIRELDILNHYIGMPPIETPALEVAIFPAGIALLAALCLLAPLHRWLHRLAAAGTAITPLAILADLQWRLYVFGHSLSPTAPIRLEPFTPLVLGETHMGNFESHGMPSWGLVCLAAAFVLVLLSGRARGRRAARLPGAARSAAGAAMAVLLGAPTAQAQPAALQALIDAAPSGSTVQVPPGTYSGPIVIRGPLTVTGLPGAVIDGLGRGSVVTIAGDGVVFRGFTVRNSGHQVTEEAAGIKVTGGGHRIEGNVVRDVYFGIHAGAGAHTVIQDNAVAPGRHRGARPGHGISIWNLTDSQVRRNRIQDARDGIYLSFTDRVSVSGNVVTGCRYGLHSMYSHDARFEDNEASGNLLGAALMMSDRLVLTGNRIRQHREGTAAYGILLKDIGDLRAEGNLILANRVGLYAEGVPSQPSREAVFAGNVIAGNEVGIALQGTAALVLTGNRIAENLTDVRLLGTRLAPGMRWSRDGRGNSWSQYRGFDADRDGIGDVPHVADDVMEALVRRNPLAQAFLYTPAHLALEAAARMFPLYRRAPMIVDTHPLMQLPVRVPR